jgi:hypothetical protein
MLGLLGLVDYSSDENGLEIQENEEETRESDDRDQRKVNQENENETMGSTHRQFTEQKSFSHQSPVTADCHVQEPTHKDQLHVRSNASDSGSGNGIRNENQKIPNQQTVERMKHYLQLKSQGFNLTDSIRRKKDFGNPYILQKVIDYYHIDEVPSLTVSRHLPFLLVFRWVRITHYISGTHRCINPRRLVLTNFCF